MSAESTFHNNTLRVGGLVPLTMTDLPGKLSAVIFCQGCPWRCAYCHNSHLIPSRTKNEIPWKSVVSFLEKRRDLLDAVVFSGGEPTMQSELLPAMKTVHEMGFEIGLHTAGQYPERLAKVLPIVSWVGMDIKAPFGESSRITRRTSIDNDRKIKESISLILQSKAQYEFRTTVHPFLLSTRDIQKIAEDLSNMGVTRYILQEFRPTGCINQALNEASFDSLSNIREVVSIADSFDYFEIRVA